MQTVYKILRVTAWLLLIATTLTLATGIPAFGRALANFFGIQLAGSHAQYAMFFFLPLFYIHAVAGFLSLTTRHRWLNKLPIKIIIIFAWTALIASFVVAYSLHFFAPALPNAPKETSASIMQPSDVALFSSAEVATHNNENDCWIIVSGKVYSVTSLIATHSGGEKSILASCGKDGTEPFMTKDKNPARAHSENAASILEHYYIGDLTK